LLKKFNATFAPIKIGVYPETPALKDFNTHVQLRVEFTH
jgi:hypothetical protein